MTSLTEVANGARLGIQSTNKLLLPPAETKTFSKPRFENEVERTEHHGNNERMVTVRSTK